MHSRVKGPAKIQAKQLVRTRNQVKQMYTMKSQLTSIGMVMSQARINQQMVNAMTGVTQVMGDVNENMNMNQIKNVC
jgi:charged multivesicular body protein 2A